MVSPFPFARDHLASEDMVRKGRNKLALEDLIASGTRDEDSTSSQSRARSNLRKPRSKPSAAFALKEDLARTAGKPLEYCKTSLRKRFFFVWQISLSDLQIAQASEQSKLLHLRSFRTCSARVWIQTSLQQY